MSPNTRNIQYSDSSHFSRIFPLLNLNCCILYLNAYLHFSSIWDNIHTFLGHRVKNLKLHRTETKQIIYQTKSHCDTFNTWFRRNLADSETTFEFQLRSPHPRTNPDMQSSYLYLRWLLYNTNLETIDQMNILVNLQKCWPLWESGTIIHTVKIFFEKI
jgi:hypothetical protein